MRHYCEKNGDVIGHCDDCQKAFESEKHICPHCWQEVSNKAYFGTRGNSVHLSGKCGDRQPIPASAFERQTLKKNWQPPWTANKLWEQNEKNLDRRRTYWIEQERINHNRAVTSAEENDNE